MMDLNSELLTQFKSSLLAHTEMEPKVQASEKHQKWSYLCAAAVLSSFDPELLLPLDANQKSAFPKSLIFDDIVNLPGGISQGLYMLKPAVRKQALDSLGGLSEMRKALAANPERIQDDLQRLWEKYLEDGRFEDLQSYSYYELLNIDQILSWIPSSIDLLDSKNLLAEVLRKKSILLDFEHLCAVNFVGREAELKTLHRQYTKGRPAVLSIYGPGGIGKSALIGQFLSTLARTDQDNGVFAYLAFDQTKLSITRPYTILLEALQQFNKQVRGLSNELTMFIKKFTDVSGLKTDLVLRTIVYGTRSQRMNAGNQAIETLYRSFLKILKKLRSIHQIKYRVTIVLDTFEEVQYRDREGLTGFWDMVYFLCDNDAWLSFIIAGRQPIGYQGYDHQEINLGRLSQRDQRNYLNKLGVKDLKLSDFIAAKVGGSPLSLKLAASLIKRLADDGEENLMEVLDSSITLQIDEALIQGQLYQRILNHIHDDRVRVLAHPGMILRVISPELITQVLSPVCDIDVSDDLDALMLYNRLREEHTLVRTSETGLLQYRPEVRSAMIRLLTQDKYAEVREIHRAAVRYYQSQAQDSLSDRAEELYHRLALDEDDFNTLDYRWMKGIEDSINANLEEYSDRMKVWLSSRTSLEVSRGIYIDADIRDWERNITRKVKRALLSGKITSAIFLLDERSERSTNSPLFAIEAKLYLLEEDIETAQKIIRQGLLQLSASGNRGRIAELHWLDAQAYLLRGEQSQAGKALERARLAMEKASSKIPLIQILVHQTMLCVDQIQERRNLLQRLNEALSQIKQSVEYDLEFILKMGVTLIKEEFPHTAARVAGYLRDPSDFAIDYQMLETESLRGLKEYREEWEEDEEDNTEFESYI